MAGKPRLDTRWPDCEEWTHARNAGGYGIRRWRGRSWLAHRVTWTNVRGEIPAGLDVLHCCDNPPCVNINHLYIGTDADNGADKRARGRGATGDKRGERNSVARLTTAKVAEARALYATGAYGYAELGAMFGVDGGTIGYAIRGRTWNSDGSAKPVKRVRTHCKRGHTLDGQTICRVCHLARRRVYNQKSKEARRHP